MLALAFAALLATTPVQHVDPQSAPQSAPTDLGEIEVVGRPLESMIRSFVNEVAAPNRHRGLARWKNDICIGVANLRPETAQYILDRVSTIAEDVGLNPGRPGCSPNVIIIATDDPDGLTQRIIQDRGGALRMGGAGMDRGGAALRAFAASDRPVRWWQVSMPVDSFTGQRAIRIPGECTGSCSSPLDMAPILTSTSSTRLGTQIVDNLFRTVVILDVNQVDRVSGQQLADYVALVSLAQIDPEADTSGYASVLNIFEDPDSTDGLTNWDRAYLNGLYDAERTRANLRSGRGEIADSINRAHQRLAQQQDDTLD